MFPVKYPAVGTVPPAKLIAGSPLIAEEVIDTAAPATVAFEPRILLSFHVFPTVIDEPPPVALESAASNHKQHPGTLRGSKP
jgi:hypothetical protein